MKLWAGQGQIQSQTILRILLLLFLPGIAACGEGGLFEDSSARATREAQATSNYQTAQVAVNQGQTLSALLSTVDSSTVLQTQVAALQQQNTDYLATIAVMNSTRNPPPSAFNQQTAATPPPASNTGNQSSGAAAADTAPDTEVQESDQSAAASATTYVDTTTATGVRDSDGCAQGETSLFDADEDLIYLITEVHNVAKGTEFSSRWYHNGQLRLETDSWTPNQDYAEICIWFYIEQGTDFDFSPGGWIAELVANGRAVTQASFQISGGAEAAPVEDNTDDMPDEESTTGQ